MINEADQDLLVRELLEPSEELESAILARCAADPEFAKARAGFRALADLFAEGTPALPPPPGLKQRVLTRVDESIASRAPREAEAASHAWIGWAAAACILAFFGASLAFSVFDSRPLIVEDVRERKDSEILVLRCPKEKVPGIVQIVWDGHQLGWDLRAENVPEPPRGMTYQVWVVDPALKQPVSCGTIRPNCHGQMKAFIRPDQPISHMAAFAITLEPVGGSREATTEPVFIGA